MEDTSTFTLVRWYLDIVRQVLLIWAQPLPLWQLIQPFLIEGVVALFPIVVQLHFRQHFFHFFGVRVGVWDLLCGTAEANRREDEVFGNQDFFT